MAATEVWSGDYLWRQFENALLNPIRAFRPRYLPLLMVYFAYGAHGPHRRRGELLGQEGADLDAGRARRARGLDRRCRGP